MEREKNGNASSNTIAACVVVCCPSQTQMTTRESFLTIGCYIMQKDKMSKQAWEEQREVNYRLTRWQKCTGGNHRSENRVGCSGAMRVRGMMGCQ